MLGDVLKRRINLLSKSSVNRNDKNAFWKEIKDIAIEEICELNASVDSNVIISVYYKILKENENQIPQWYKEKIKSNGQETYRVITRNIFSSNAFHNNGIAKSKMLEAKKIINSDRRGYKIVYKCRKG